jgi:hypothetical protein
VTLVTTERVTRGTLVQVVGTVSGHVADRCADVVGVDWERYGHVDHLEDDKWQGIGECCRAMWPRRGLPHGT